MPYRTTPATRARLDAVRERIVASARDQVAEAGYASASVSAVASRAGVATGSVYRHFPSKANLFAEVFRRASQRELDVVAAVTSDESLPPSERVAAAAEAFARRALAAPTMAYALLAEPVDPAVEAERLTFRRGYRDAFARVLHEGIASGEFREHDPEIAAAAIVGALGEALVGPLSPAANGRGARRHHEALVAGLVQFCLNAIATREGKSHVGARSHA
ncbi:MAG TPA: TetR/AcrR family transcriptional regulator [Thermoleophilaceae bacterium]